MSFLPSNNLEPPPRFEPTTTPSAKTRRSTRSSPTTPPSPTTCASVISRIVDDGEFFEVHEHFAKNIVCGFSRLDGFPVGIVGNQPAYLAGVLDIEASEKAARFVRTCDAFNVPFSPSPTSPASCPAPRRSGAGSSATAPSCSTPSPRRPSRS